MRIAGKAIVIGGLVGGALDLAFALLFAHANGLPPIRLLQIIASGLFGNASFDMGTTGAVVGVICHFAISLIWAAIFVAISQKYVAMRSNWWLSGPLFGAAVFLCMRLAILPISAYPKPVNFNMPGSAYDLLSHMFLFGLPIAVSARFLTSRRYA